MRPLVVGIDFNNLVYGSYYGEKLLNSKGVNINAIQSFFFKLNTIKESLTPNYIVLANDLNRNSTFRKKLFKDYKSTRKTTDPDIFEQMKRCIQIAALLGYPFINNPLYEADDILGMLSKYCTDKEYDMIIVSSDKDLYQLINDNVWVYSIRNKEMIDKEWMYNKYHLTPEQWVELKILMGDRSDNVPGMDGVGEISALRLLHEYGSLDRIYSNLKSLRPKLRDSLVKGKEYIPLMRTLVTIVTDYNLISLDESMLMKNEMILGELFEVLNELELYPLMNIMRYSLGGSEYNVQG